MQYTERNYDISTEKVAFHKYELLINISCDQNSCILPLGDNLTEVVIKLQLNGKKPLFSSKISVKTIFKSVKTMIKMAYM